MIFCNVYICQTNGTPTSIQNALYMMQYREIASEVEHVTFSVFYLIEVLIWRGTFCWKPHLNGTRGYKVMSRQLKDSQNNRKQKKFIPFFWLCLTITPDFWLILLDRNKYIDYQCMAKGLLSLIPKLIPTVFVLADLVLKLVKLWMEGNHNDKIMCKMLSRFKWSVSIASFF